MALSHVGLVATGLWTFMFTWSHQFGILGVCGGRLKGVSFVRTAVSSSGPHRDVIGWLLYRWAELIISCNVKSMWVKRMAFARKFVKRLYLKRCTKIFCIVHSAAFYRKIIHFRYLRRGRNRLYIFGIIFVYQTKTWKKNNFVQCVRLSIWTCII